MGNARAIVFGAALVGLMVSCKKLPELLGDKPAEEEHAETETVADSATPDSPTPVAVEENEDVEEVEVEEDAEVDVPTLAWQIEFAGTPREVAMTADGTLVVASDQKMVGIREGKEAWSKDGAFGDLAQLEDGSMVASRGGEIVGFNSGDGSEAFAIAPGGPGKESPPQVVGAAVTGNEILVATEDAQFFGLDAAACKEGTDGCVRPAGRLRGEYLELGARLVAGADGTRYLVEDNVLRRFNPEFEVQFRLEAHSNLTGVVPVAEGRLGLAYGGEVALLDVAQCDKAKAFSLPRGRATDAPSKCLLWRYDHGADNAPPAVIDADTLALNAKGGLQAVAAGDDVWKLPLGSVGPVLRDDNGQLLTISAEEPDGDEGSALAVRAVSPDDAAVQWELPLPYRAQGDAMATAPMFVRGGRWLAAGVGEKVAVLRIP